MVFRKFALVAAAIALGAQAPSPIEGVWDLIWQTRHGPERSGYLVIHRQGERVIAEIHGKGAIKASGSATGSTFEFRGNRMFVPYTITGSYSGDLMQGQLKVMSVDKHFTAARRRSR
jgi:hypothetical protein